LSNAIKEGCKSCAAARVVISRMKSKLVKSGRPFRPDYGKMNALRLGPKATMPSLSFVPGAGW